MDESFLLAFLTSATTFFLRATGEEANLGPAELLFGGVVFGDLVGRIDISGSAAGCFYMGCSRELLDDFLTHLGEPDRSARNQRDALGEIASVIASGCRRDFGEHFLISVPVVETGSEATLGTADLIAMRVPLTWRGHAAQLLISLGGPTAPEGSRPPGGAP